MNHTTRPYPMAAMTPLDALERAEAEVMRPKHGEDTWEQKMAWDRFHEAGQVLDRLLRNHARDLIAVARAAQDLDSAEMDACDYVGEAPSYQRLAAALVPLLNPEAPKGDSE